MAKMTMKAFEKSAMDKKMDKAGAKKAGVSMKKWEGSKADNAADKKAMSKLNSGKSKAFRKGGKVC